MSKRGCIHIERVQAMVDLRQGPLFPTGYEEAFEFRGALYYG